MFTCTVALAPSALHFLKPNKIMQLSNLKLRPAAVNNTSTEWTPMIASLYFLLLLGFTICSSNNSNTGEADLAQICSCHFGLTSIAFRFCRGRWTEHAIDQIISASAGRSSVARPRCHPLPSHFAAVELPCLATQYNIIIICVSQACGPLHHLQHFGPFTHQRF